MYQVKAQTARSVIPSCLLVLLSHALTGSSMFYQQNNTRYLLDLIDTPVRGTLPYLYDVSSECSQRAMLISPGRCLVQWWLAKVHSYSLMRVKVSKRSPYLYFTLHGKEVSR